MTDTTWTTAAEISAPNLRDYYELLKPRVMRLVVFTSLSGLIIAPDPVHPIIAIISLLSIALGAGASGALNMWIDQDIDAQMKRTLSRPIPSGRVPAAHALFLGLFASGFSVMMLGLFANWAAAGFLAFTIFFYTVIYSLILKRKTPQNIVIGGASGAFPPMIGWMVATGSISLESIMLFFVIFLWTPAHFWSLALFRNEDYARAKVPMMPVIAGEASTRRQILIYSSLFVLTCLLTSFSSIGGPICFTVSLILGAIFITQSVSLMHLSKDTSTGFRAEKRFFALSIIFLFLFFLALLGDDLLTNFINFRETWTMIGLK